jgi:transcriptional regulator with XRE-family HTH domain
MAATTRPYRPAGARVDGDAVRRLRIRAGLTVTDLAKKVGVSVSFLSRVERCVQHGMSPPTFNRLAEALGLSKTPEQIQPPEEAGPASKAVA